MFEPIVLLSAGIAATITSLLIIYLLLKYTFSLRGKVKRLRGCRRMKFRSHRGVLQDSLKTEVEVESCEHLMELAEDVIGTPITQYNIILKYYKYDERVEKDLFLLLVGEMPVGYVYDFIGGAG